MHRDCALNAFQLKLLAAALMLADHIGYLLLPELTMLRALGRLSFPLFAFMAANSYCHTRSVSRYLLRLALFAIFFQPIYSLCMATSRLNIFATLFLGLLAILAQDQLAAAIKGPIGLILGCLAVLPIALAAQILNTDYGFYGVALIVTAKMFYRQPLPLAGAWLAVNGLSFTGWAGLGPIQSLSLLSLPLIAAYNGKKGPGWRWFFYAFYCLHIPILYIVKLLTASG